MSSILVYESLSGGGFGPEADTEALRELMPQGVAMRDMIVGALLGQPDVELSVVECAQAPWAPAESSAPRPPVRRLTLPRGETEAEGVRRLSRNHDIVWAVAPESDARLVSLARAVGADRWAGSDVDTLALVGSKSACVEHLHACGLPTPLAFDDPTNDVWVLKPDAGAGSIETWQLPRDAAQAAAARWRAEGRVPCLQPWVRGEAMSMSLLVRAEGVSCVSLNRQHLRRTDDGRLHFEGVGPVTADVAAARRPAAQALAERLHLALPGLRGLVGVDLVWHPERGPVLIEVNARVTMACLTWEPSRLARLARAHLQACGFDIGVLHDPA